MRPGSLPGRPEGSQVPTITEPPYNDIWTIKSEGAMLAEWKIADAEFCNSADSLYFYHEQQIDDFLTAVGNGMRPLIDGLGGRKTVELVTAIYRSAWMVRSTRSRAARSSRSSAFRRRRSACSSVPERPVALDRFGHYQLRTIALCCRQCESHFFSLPVLHTTVLRKKSPL
jgi:hypothetical protein